MAELECRCRFSPPERRYIGSRTNRSRGGGSATARARPNQKSSAQTGAWGTRESKGVRTTRKRGRKGGRGRGGGAPLKRAVRKRDALVGVIASRNRSTGIFCVASFLGVFGRRRRQRRRLVLGGSPATRSNGFCVSARHALDGRVSPAVGGLPYWET